MNYKINIMYCYICGKEIENDSVFCCYCGATMPQSANKDITPEDIDGRKCENCDINADDDGCQTTNSNLRQTITSKNDLLKEICKALMSRKYIIILLFIVVGLSTTIYIVNNNKSESSYFDEANTTIKSYETEDERWDAESCIYSNFKYGIAFNLTRSVSWEKISGTGKHTIVKFLQPETGLTMFANINPIEINLRSDDIWQKYDEFIKLYRANVLPYIAKNNGIKITNFSHRKSEISGKHSIKINFQYTIDDDRYQGNISYSSVEYVFIHNSSIICVSATCLDEYLNFLLDEGISLEFFLKSFHLTHTKV